jgi:cyclic pyranopterin phosphate synthase
VKKITHVDASGRASMVDVGSKPESARVAIAEGTIRMSAAAFDAVRENRGPKGAVLTTAELAGTMGAKRTAELIPLCHPVALDQVDVKTELDGSLPGVRVTATAKTTGRTGVEMEALTAVAVALLTVYDMVKAADRGMEIGAIRLLEKSGGKSGSWSKGAPER